MAKVEAPLPPRPFTEAILLEQEAMEIVVNNGWQAYCNPRVKALLDRMADPPPTALQYFPAESGNEYVYAVPAREGAEGAVRIRASRSKGTAAVSVRLPMTALRVPRPGKQRKERFAVAWKPDSPYGPALQIFTRALRNDPTASRKAGEQEEAKEAKG